MFTAVNCIISVLYFFSIFQNLTLGHKIINLVSIGLLVYLLVRRKIYLMAKPKFAQLNIVLFLTFIIVNLIFFNSIDKEFKFLAWDEYAGWALGSKYLNQFGESYLNSEIIVLNYPPGQSLFHYFITNIFGWSEKMVLYSQILLILIIIYAILELIKIDRKVVQPIVFLNIVLLPYLFNFGYHTIVADLLLGMFLTFGVAYAIFSDRIDLRVLFFYFVVIVIIKPYGIIFALIVVLFISLRNDLHKTKLIAMIVNILFPYLLWNYSLEGIRNRMVQSTFTFDFAVQEKLISTLGATVKKIISPVESDAYNIWFEGIRLSPLILIMIMSACSVIAETQYFKILSHLRVKIAYLFFLSLMIYLAFLTLSYVYFFSDYESRTTASFIRYLSSFLIAWLIVLVLIIQKLTVTKKNIINVVLNISILIVLINLINVKKDMFHINRYSEALVGRQLAEDVINLKIKPNVKFGDSIYYIDQNTDGYSTFRFRYLILPNRVNSWCWSFGVKYSENDLWTCGKDGVEEQSLRDNLKEYDYLYIESADDNLNNYIKYEELFNGDVKSQHLYKVQKNANSKLTIKEIG